jgi:hypothetical protein
VTATSAESRRCRERGSRACRAGAVSWLPLHAVTRLLVAARTRWVCPRCRQTVTEGVAPFRRPPRCTCQGRYKATDMTPTTTEANQP